MVQNIFGVFIEKYGWGKDNKVKIELRLEKEMATHSSVLALRIPGTAEPGGLPSVESHRVGHDWSDLATAAAAAAELRLEILNNFIQQALGCKGGS